MAELTGVVRVNRLIVRRMLLIHRGGVQLTVAGRRIAGDRRVLWLAEHEARIAAAVREVLRRMASRSTQRCERRLVLTVRRHVVRMVAIEQVHLLVASGHRRASIEIGEHLVAGLSDAAVAEAVGQADHLGARRARHAIAAIYTVRTARTGGRSIPRVRVLRVDMARSAGLLLLLLLLRHRRRLQATGECGGTRGFLRFRGYI